jgi:uncharacterized membrane protein
LIPYLVWNLIHSSLSISRTSTTDMVLICIRRLEYPLFTAISARCFIILLLLQKFLSDTISDFAQILAPCRANNSTNQILHTGLAISVLKKCVWLD